MKVGDVLTYCRARLTALGRTEWVDNFNFENIPKPRLDKAFHLQVGTALGVSNNQDNQVGRVPIIIRLPYSPARLVKPIRDEAVLFADEVISDFIDPRHRCVQTNSIKNVFYDTLALEPLANSNDNGLIVNLNFTMLVITSTR